MLSMRSALCLFTVAGTAACALADLPNGVASGETTSNSTLLWTRATAPGAVTFEVATDPSFTNIVSTQGGVVTDPAAPIKAPVSGLNAGTKYYYRAIETSTGTVAAGTFKTAMGANQRGAFRMGVSGDWRGELAPYPSLRNAATRNLDLWMSLGDTIYADVASPAVPTGQAQNLSEFRLKHNEVLSERFGLNVHRDIRQSTSVMATIDDHEVTNDFEGGETIGNDPRFAGNPTDLVNQSQLYRDGLQAFTEYHPMESRTYSATGDARFDGRPDLYRTQRQGKTAQVFSVDARSFRDAGLPAADPANPATWGPYIASTYTPGRTMLGNAQFDRLKADLLNSQNDGVTWKFVMVPEPIQNLGVLAASDRFEGYAAERANLLQFIDQNDIENVVFIAADIHGTLVNNLTYATGPGQPQIQTDAWEITTGSGAYFAPFGPTVAGLAADLNLPGAIPLNAYLGLPASQQEIYIQGLINAQTGALGYDPLGLQGSSIAAQLLQGTWSATNTFGWTEFDIDPLTQALTVTTYGTPYYDEATLLANPNLIAGLQPTIVQQFVVQAVPAPASIALLALGGFAARRRSR